MTDAGTILAFRVEATTTVYVGILNPDVIERITGPDGDVWRSQFYSLHTAEDVVAHFAYNAVTNGITDISRLDGWADLDEDAADIYVHQTVTEAAPW